MTETCLKTKKRQKILLVKWEYFQLIETKSVAKKKQEVQKDKGKRKRCMHKFIMVWTTCPISSPLNS